MLRVVHWFMTSLIVLMSVTQKIASLECALVWKNVFQQVVISLELPLDDANSFLLKRDKPECLHIRKWGRRMPALHLMTHV